MPLMPCYTHSCSAYDAVGLTCHRKGQAQCNAHRVYNMSREDIFIDEMQETGFELWAVRIIQQIVPGCFFTTEFMYHAFLIPDRFQPHCPLGTKKFVAFFQEIELSLKSHRTR